MGRNYAHNRLRQFVRHMCQQTAYRHVRACLEEMAKTEAEKGAAGLSSHLKELLARDFLKGHDDDQVSDRIRIDFCDALLDTLGEYDHGAFLSLLMSDHGFMSKRDDIRLKWAQEIDAGQGRWRKPTPDVTPSGGRGTR